LPGGSPGAARVSGRFCSSTGCVDASSIGLLTVYALAFQFLIFAQQQPAAPAADADPNSLFRMLLPLIIIFGLFYFLMLRPQKKKEDEFKQLVANLKESDHVITIGGIHGVVTNVQRDADRVTIRVDDSTGTKLRINTSAIARVVTDDDSNGKSTGGISK
jgi:preprotein translocase subunit YajC